ncbi:MAG: hypothetical protein HYU66_07170, partial [Armatimonadetes bacterium]|nr:hypothetical protein [Armatimonadota bacterium]
VRANLLGEPVVTPPETDSTVRAKLGPGWPPLPASTHRPILWEQDPPKPAAPLPVADRGRQVLFDLQGPCNVTFEEPSKTRFRFDSSDGEQTLEGWWGNPGLAGQPARRAVEAAGVTFLTSGRPRPGTGIAPKNLLAVSSWPPQPLPSAATIAVGLRLSRLWLLLQSYAHPMKNYVVNGEVVLHYADGTTAVTALVPPYNLDCWFQHFAREGAPVELGRLGHPGGFWIPLPTFAAGTHADALEITCEPAKEIASVEVRGTCSEGVIGEAGMTGLQ